jgi:membrane-associated phospholipid phosphatase
MFKTIACLMGSLLFICNTNIAAQDSITVPVRPVTTVQINDSTQIGYERPKAYTFLTNVPCDWAQAGKMAVSKKGLITLSAVAVTTLLCLTIDRQAMDAVQQFGRWSGINGERKFKTGIGFKLGGLKVNMLDLPENLNSTLYFIGEGWPSIVLTAGVLTKGLITKDDRAILTASQFAESYIAMGVTIQVLKRLTGRQSPFVATSRTGEWHWLPTPSDYQAHVPKHDAFPSGHLATAMATVTIYAENYPEYKYIRPVGYSMIGLIGLAMMNNGVHWLSDYPLALAVGYVYGKIATSRGKTIHFIQKMRPDEKEKGKITIQPATTYNAIGMRMSLNL